MKPLPRHVSLAVGLTWAAAVSVGRAAAAEADATAGSAVMEVAEAGAEAVSPSPDLLVQQGIELRKSGDDRRALIAFEQAWALGGSPQSLAQLALAEQALGRWREAYEHLESALLKMDDPWIALHWETLEGTLREIASRLGALEITCNVDGAEVHLDGRVLGRTPLASAARLVAGESVIRVSAKGYFDVTRQVQVDARGLARLDVTLTPSAPARGAVPVEPVGVHESASRAPAVPFTVASDGERGNSARDVFTYSSLALAALGVTAGVTGYWMRETNVRLYNDDERCNKTAGVRRSEECRGEAAAWRKGETIAITGFSAAGVFGLTALYLWLDRPSAAQEAKLVCSLGSASIGCQGRF